MLFDIIHTDSVIKQTEAVTAMENCITDIRTWMVHDRLMVNNNNNSRNTG